MMRIDVGSVLRYSANLPYADLVTRSTGAAVRRCIEAELAALADDDVATLDFTAIGMMDYSCADEVVAKLLLDLARRGARPSQLVFHGITDAHLEAIEDVLRHHGLALVVHFADGAARLVGAVSDDMRPPGTVVRASSLPAHLAWRAMPRLQHGHRTTVAFAGAALVWLAIGRSSDSPALRRPI